MRSRSVQVSLCQVRSCENRSGPMRSSQDQLKYRSGRVKSGDSMIRPGQVKVRSFHVMSGQYKVKSGMLASGYGRSGQVGTDWVRS